MTVRVVRYVTTCQWVADTRWEQFRSFQNHHLEKIERFKSKLDVFIYVDLEALWCPFQTNLKTFYRILRILKCQSWLFWLSLTTMWEKEDLLMLKMIRGAPNNVLGYCKMFWGFWLGLMVIFAKNIFSFLKLLKNARLRNSEIM